MTGPALDPGSSLPPGEREITRGVARLLLAHGMASIAQVPFPNGRRADVVGLGPDGALWVVEVKSSIEDFKSDQKWSEYRDYCDQFCFAVAPHFPAGILPPETGLIVADRFGGELVRPAPVHKLTAARRKSMILRFGRLAAQRLQAEADPGSIVDLAAAWREPG